MSRRVGASLLLSVERLLVDPHQAARLIGFALILDVVELVAELAVLALVVVVVLHLPDRFELARLGKLDKQRGRRWLSLRQT